MRSVIEALADRFNARELLQFGAMPPRGWEPPLLVANMKKLTDLGIEARTPMAQAIDRMLAEPVDAGKQ